MEIIFISWIGSIIISVFIGNVVGSHYLKVNDKKWEDTFGYMIDHINKIISHRQK